MADAVARLVLPNHAGASSSDGGASRVDIDEESVDTARARAGECRAVARVVPRIIRRSLRAARRCHQSAAAARMIANRKVIRFEQQDWHFRSPGEPAPPAIECVDSSRDVIMPVTCSIKTPRRPSHKKSRLESTASPPKLCTVGAGAAVAAAPATIQAAMEQLSDAKERARVHPTMLRAVRPAPRMQTYVPIRRSWRRVEVSSASIVAPPSGSTQVDDTGNRAQNTGVPTKRLISHMSYASAASPYGRDAPGDEERRAEDADHSLARRTRTFMDRHAIATVISVLHANTVVLRDVRRVLRLRRSAAGQILEQIRAQLAPEMAVQLVRSAAAARRSALQRQTVGACLAAVPVGGATAEFLGRVSAADGLTGSQSLGAREKPRTTGPAISRHYSAALHDGVASALSV